MKTYIIYLAALLYGTISIGQNAKEFFERGYEKFEVVDYKGAIADYDIAIKINPDNEEVYFFRGMAKWILEDYKAAIIDFSKTIEIRPDYLFAYMLRGLVRILPIRKK